MNEIKVTVTYDKPSTAKFDALMAEYEAAKKCADETVAYYKPLADVAEEAKFDAIMEQLETIKDYARRISEINNGNSVWITIHIPISVCGGREAEKFSITYRPTETTFMWCYSTRYGDFKKEYLKHYNGGTYNLVVMWDEWEVYNKLEEEACNQLHQAINNQKRRGNHEKNRYYNIVK